MREKFSIRLISINEISEVTNWARLEGFSPGMDDVSIYRNTDKQGVWVACLDTVSYTHLTLPTILLV